jgi:glucosyl-dolichyl phosphate glucuronosyltransferase
MPKISLVICTYNRTKLTDQFLEHNLSNMGVEERPEIIWIDNGSSDGVEEIVEKWKPDIFLKRPNDCLSKSKNAAYALCRGDYVLDLENDFFMPDNWLKEMIEYAEAIPNTGIMATKVEGWEDVIKLEYNTPTQIINGKEVIVCRSIGPRMFSKEVFKRAGFLIETYGLYGNEDIEISDRSARTGLTNYIIPSMIAEHRGVGQWDCGDYRIKKDEALKGQKIELPKGQDYFNPFVTNK